MVSIPRVLGILVLDSAGDRIAAKYYTAQLGGVEQQKQFEKSLFAKTARNNARVDAEIVLVDNIVTVYKFVSDVNYYVLGPAAENELVMLSVFHALDEGMASILRGQVSKRTLLDNLDLLLLCIDEIVDDGLIVETDPQQIASRVIMQGEDDQGGGTGASRSGEQTLSRAFQTARKQFVQNIREGFQ